MRAGGSGLPVEDLVLLTVGSTSVGPATDAHGPGLWMLNGLEIAIIPSSAAFRAGTQTTLIYQFRTD